MMTITDDMIEDGAQKLYEVRVANTNSPQAFRRWEDTALQDLYRAEVREVLEAVLGGQTPSLDDLLDSLPAETRIEHFPYYRKSDDGMFHCKIIVPVKSRAISGMFAPYYGAGPTRMDAIRAAVANAKEPDDTVRDMSGYTAADYAAGRDDQP